MTARRRASTIITASVCSPKPWVRDSRSSPPHLTGDDDQRLSSSLAVAAMISRPLANSGPEREEPLPFPGDGGSRREEKTCAYQRAGQHCEGSPHQRGCHVREPEASRRHLRQPRRERNYGAHGPEKYADEHALAAMLPKETFASRDLFRVTRERPEPQQLPSEMATKPERSAVTQDGAGNSTEQQWPET